MFFGVFSFGCWSNSFFCLAKENRIKRQNGREPFWASERWALARSTGRVESKATLYPALRVPKKFTQIKGRLYVASMQQSALIQRRVGLPLYLGKIFGWIERD
jgi:hypothetical protein